MSLKKMAFTSAACLGFLTIGLWLSSNSVQAEQPPYQVGQIVQTIRADLDGDRYCEAICLKVFKLDQENAFAKLIVTDRHGKVLGRSPEISSLNDARAMGYFVWGNSDLQMAGQIKGDKPQIFVSVPRSDVRPAVFAIWTWDNKKKTLTYESSQCLLGKGSDNTFYWSKLPQDYGPHARWIETLTNPSGQLKPKNLVGKVFEYNENTPPKCERAEFTVLNKALKLSQWVPEKTTEK